MACRSEEAFFRTAIAATGDGPRARRPDSMTDARTVTPRDVSSVVSPAGTGRAGQALCPARSSDLSPLTVGQGSSDSVWARVSIMPPTETRAFAHRVRLNLEAIDAVVTVAPAKAHQVTQLVLTL